MSTPTASANGAAADHAAREAQVLVVGAGVSGIAVVHALRKQGIEDIVVIEAADEVGGTWRDNTYPGCACDVPSLLYSFSFDQNPEWTRFFAPQPEIRQYVRDVATRLGVDALIRYGTEALAARWDEAAKRWIVDTNTGEIRAQWVVAATGPLQYPRLPEIPGLESFPGPTFHTAEWDHSVDLAGLRVAVVGTGASSVQVVPHVQQQASKLVLFQRTPSWVLPRPDRKITAFEKFMLRRVPGLQNVFRQLLYVTLEGQQFGQRHPKIMQQAQKIGLRHLRRQVKDPVLREKLTPRFTLGCKRLLMSNTYFRALTAPNATVVAQAMSRIDGNTVFAADGSEYEVDAIVFGTGFHVTDPPIAANVRGRSGLSLSEAWGGSPQAYLGTMVPDAPNAFLMVGPNIGQGHTSVFLAVEAQADYIAGAVTAAREAGVEAIEVRRDVFERWNAKVQDALQGTVWNAGGCASYYLDENGRNSTIYPWSSFDLRRRLRRFALSDFHTATKGESLPAVQVGEPLATATPAA